MAQPTNQPMKRYEIMKQMLNSLPHWKEIEKHKRGAMYELSVKFPEWFFDNHPEEAVLSNLDFAINMNPEYVCEREPTYMAERLPNVLLQYRPEWMCHHNPEWVFENRPDILFEHRPNWMLQHKPEWLRYYRFHWMQENHLDILKEILPDPEFDQPAWMEEIILKYNNQ